MIGSVFPVATLNRSVMRWEDYLRTLTPVTIGESGLAYKREDYFAPLGFGGINGSKLRQLIHLVNRHQARHPETNGIITGASVLSPQLSMATLVGRHLGLPVTIVLGATKPETCGRHENVAIAQDAGASTLFTPVGFNPALQRSVARYHSRSRYRDHYQLCYGITTPNSASAEDIEAFHAVGARQVANIPEHVETLTMTAGSCNSAISVLYGIARRPPNGLRRVVLVGIGPNKVKWMIHRMRLIEQVSGVPILSLFTRRHVHQPELDAGTGDILLESYDLHTTGWTSYQARRPWRQDGIDFHPTYEGKAMAYLHEMGPPWWRDPEGRTLLWIVGSAPNRKVISQALAEAA